MKKVAISLPDAQADAIERIRRKQRIPRSRVIQRAIAVYLAEQAGYGAVRAYEGGYRRKPERMKEVEALGKATAASLDLENWE